MLNPAIKLFNFYRRYRWRAQDFTDLQEAHISTIRGHFEALFGGAVLAGFEVTLNGVEIQLAPGAGLYGNVAGCFVGTAGQVLRFHTSGSVNSTSVAVRGSVVKVSN